ncbi:MAG TPA: acetyltransferase [Candidatus Angelobacter sp.]|nr:acetyltransferase [Candidatus Angelobacter sp.]
MEGGVTDVVIIGAGGTGREVCWILQESNEVKPQWHLLGFVDDNRALHGSMQCDLLVLGGFEWLAANAKKNLKVICAVGSPHARKTLTDRASGIGLSFCAAIHPSVQMSRWVKVGSGSIIEAGCVLTTQVTVGPHTLLNTNCTVGHDARIGSFCCINPGCHISGAAKIGEGVELGAGSVVIQGRNVGDWSVIGAGAVVISDIPTGVTAVGVPSRVIKQHMTEPLVIV